MSTSRVQRPQARPAWSGGPQIPTVLVVGDFRTGTTPFAASAWEEVRRAYQDLGPDFGESLSSFDGSQPTPAELFPSLTPSRDELRTLYPIPFTDSGNAHAASFVKSLYDHLQYYDVRGIISCGTATNTQGLMSALDFVGVPVLVTIDSTIATVVERRWDVLRLIPNNEQQAQAIVAKVKTELKDKETDVWLFGYPSVDLYVDDLHTAIQVQADSSRLALQPVLNLKDLARDRDIFVICVGYYDALNKVYERLRQLRQNCKKEFHVITSDGCYGDPRVRGHLPHGDVNARLWWTRPTVEASQYAHDAYRALCSVWKQYGRANAHDVTRGLTPRERVKPILEFIRERLEKLPAYRFRAWDNQRGGYNVVEFQRNRGAQYEEEESSETELMPE